MLAVFIVSLFVDILVAAYLYREAFVVRSNMNQKYKRRFVILLGVMVAALALAGKNLLLACLLAGLPAGAILLFGLLLGIALFSHKGPWH